VKVLFARINLTPYTLIYFFLIFLTCIVMVALQLALLADNTAAVKKLSGIATATNVSQGFAVNANGVLQYCDRIPGMNAAQCFPIVPTTVSGETAGGFILTWRRHIQEAETSTNNASRQTRSREYSRRSHRPTTSMMISLRRRYNFAQAPMQFQTQPPTSSGVADTNCSEALVWLEGTLNDASREDLVTLAFQFWLFSLGAVAILSESLPHLGASILGHALITCWAGFRVRAFYNMMDFYQDVIVSSACADNNLLGDWWQVKIYHAIPVVVVSGIALAFMLFLSYKIYKVFSTRIFSAVGVTPIIERVHKIVLLFSVSLHLTVFFVIASTAMWINKATNSDVSFLAVNNRSSLAAGAITLLLIIPWMFLGWFCIRRESRWRFLTFCLISVLLLTIFTVMFWNGSYRFIFTSWPFFTTITITGYVLVTVSIILGIWCRFNFGHGYAHFVQVNEVLENMDFPSFYFPEEDDAERGIKIPGGNQTLEIPPVPLSAGGRPPLKSRIMRASVYSNHNIATVKLSSSQPLHSEMANASLSPTPSVRSVTQRLRRVFEYRRTNESPPLPIPQPYSPVQASVAQCTAQGGNDDASSNAIKSDRSKRRSRSVSFGRSSVRPPHVMDPVPKSAELVPDLQRTRLGRPLPIRPLPKPPTPASNTGALLTRRGGLREPGPKHRLDQID